MSKRPFAQKMMAGEIPPAPIGQTPGMRIVSIGENEAAFEIEAGPRHHNPMGTLHGGVLCDISDEKARGR